MEVREIRRSRRSTKLTDRAAATKRDREEREQPNEATAMFKIGDNIKCFFKFAPPQKAIWLSGVIYEVNNEEDERLATYSV